MMGFLGPLLLLLLTSPVLLYIVFPFEYEILRFLRFGKQCRNLLFHVGFEKFGVNSRLRRTTAIHFFIFFFFLTVLDY